MLNPSTKIDAPTLEIGQQVIMIACGAGPIGFARIAKLTSTRAQLDNDCWVTLADLRAYGAHRVVGSERLRLDRVALVTLELVKVVENYQSRLSLRRRRDRAKSQICDHIAMMQREYFELLSDEQLFAVQQALDEILGGRMSRRLSRIWNMPTKPKPPHPLAREGNRG